MLRLSNYSYIMSYVKGFLLHYRGQNVNTFLDKTRSISLQGLHTLEVAARTRSEYSSGQAFMCCVSLRTCVCVYVKWLMLQFFVTLRIISYVKQKTPDLTEVLRRADGAT